MTIIDEQNKDIVEAEVVETEPVTEEQVLEENQSATEVEAEPSSDGIEDNSVQATEDVAEVAVTEQAQQPSSDEVEVPPETPNPIPDTAVNIEIPPIAEEAGDVEGIERAKEELAQIHGEPITEVEEQKVLEDKPAEEVNVVKDTPAGEIKPYTIRSEETGDKVYVVVNGKRYWIKNPETLKKLGFNLGGESNIPFAELLKFPEGKPADLTIPGAVNPWDEPEEEQPSADGTSVWN